MSDYREMELLVQADVDGELSPAEAARVAAHVEGCATCAGLQADLLALQSRLRGATRHPAPALLRQAIRLQTASRPAPWMSYKRGRLGAWAAGLAFAASIILVILPRGDALRDGVVTLHLRALQPGHLLDVESTDQHTVKPWFDGRIDFAPPVRDFAAEGFPLAGGRLDVLDGRPVAVLVYRRRQHLIDVVIEPGGAPADTEAQVKGYNVVRWSRGGMAFWAVSDLNRPELAAFARLWR